MDHLIYILAICISAPILLMMIVADKKSRWLLGFMVVGISISVLSAEVNAILKDSLNNKMDYFHITTSVTPLSEEILKALPLLFVAVFITDKRQKIFTGALAIGVGFAVMENTFILLQNIESVSLLWAMIRGFASGLMHFLCTLMVGVGISMVRKRRKLFFAGTFALLASATLYHSLFNMLVQSPCMYLGAILPIATYIPLAILSYRKRWNIAIK